MTYIKSRLALALTALLGTSAWAVSYSDYRKSDGTPQAVMLSYYDGPASRGFTWQTDTSVTSGNVWLRQGDYTTKDDIVNSATMTISATAKSQSSCYSYKANVSNLSDGLWSYCLGNGDAVVCGQFTVKATPTGPITVVNVNDVQTRYANKLYMWENTVAAITNQLGSGTAADFILSGGDFIDNAVSGVDDYVEWGVAADTAGPAFGSTPWIMASGNHDPNLYDDLVGELFHQKSDPAGCHAFNYGNVHVATIPYASSISTAVADWLEADLASGAATNAHWRVVMMHYGPYTTADHGQDASSTYIATVTGLMKDGRVDLVLQAHDHTYSKTWPYRWSGAGYTKSETDASVVNLTPATTNVDDVAYDLNPEGTYYVSAGCAGHRVGEQKELAASGYRSREYKIVTSTNSLTGANASQDLDQSMFGVLTVDGDKLAYDWYAVNGNGTATLFDTLRVFKPSSAEPELPMPEDELECVTNVTISVGETIAFTNAFRMNSRFWLCGATHGASVASAELSVPTEAYVGRVGYVRRSTVSTNEVVVTISGVVPGEETISLGRQYKRKGPVHAVSYRVKVK